MLRQIIFSGKEELDKSQRSVNVGRNAALPKANLKFRMSRTLTIVAV